MKRQSMNRSIVWGLLFILCGSYIAGCEPKPKITDKNVVVIDDVQVAEMIQNNDKLLIIDTRPDYKYRLGHLPGAVNIPLPELEPDDSRITPDKHIVVYGDGPRNTLSHAAAKKLLTSAKLVVYDFRGGYELWTKNGRETVSGY